MLILENKCPKCYSHMVLSENGQYATLTCEDCDYTDKTKDRRAYAAVREETVEYGPKDKRLELTPTGKLFLEPGHILSRYLRETLQEAIKGLPFEEEDLPLLLKHGLVYNEDKQTEKTDDPREEVQGPVEQG